MDPEAPEVPVIASEGPVVQKAEHQANVDPDQAVLDAALGTVDDDEFLRGDETDEEAPDPIPISEDHEAAAQSWLDILQADRESYQQEAADCLLHKVQVMEIPFIENLPNKTQSTVVAGIQRVIARCSYHNFTVRRFHSDRGREFNNAKLRDYLGASGDHKTVAFPEEPQTNGRAESTIRRIKATTRAVLQEHEEGPGEWALAAKYATHCLRAKAFKTLDIKTVICPPYNAKVQVIERSLRRTHWESRTVNAKIRCPSADTAKGLVVRTENGSFLVTGKVWQSAVKPKIQIEVDGEPIEAQPLVPEVPTHRVTGKSCVEALLYPQHPVSAPSVPVERSAERLAADLFANQLFQRQHLALLVATMPAGMFRSQRSAETFGGASFFTGSWVRGNLVGLSNHARDLPNVTMYLVAFLKQRTSLPSASIGLVVGCNTAVRRDVHNQVGTSNMLLPVRLSQVSLWQRPVLCHKLVGSAVSPIARAAAW